MTRWLRPPGCGGPWAAFSSFAMEAYPTLEYQNIKGDKTYVRPPGCGGPWAAFGSGAVEAHPTLEYQQIKGDIYGGPPALLASLESSPHFGYFYLCVDHL